MENLPKASRQLHICFFPLMAQGHVIPTIAMAKLFASRGLKTTIVTTPLNTQRHSNTIQTSRHNLGLDIGLLEIELPEGSDFERLESVSTPEFAQSFSKALQKLLREHRPDCLVADVFFPWATRVAAEFGIPRIVFHGVGFFSLCVSSVLLTSQPHESVDSDSENFLVPNLPDEVYFTRKQLQPYVRRNASTASEFARIYREGKDSELESFGVVVNSFYELEPRYADHYRKILGRKAWHIGPLSLLVDNLERKEKRVAPQEPSNEHECLKWLDSNEPHSVVYICFGSVVDFSDAQLKEIAIGLESSGQRFVWVVKRERRDGAREEWVPEGFEERVEGKGVLVRGWAPQVAILQHEAVGAFVTHCGWNSTLEGVCAGVPMVTWPIAAEQFYNEKLVSRVLGIGVEVGAKKWERIVGDFVKSEAVEKAVRRVMEGEGAEEMRGRARALREMAGKAVEEGGSSHSDLRDLIQELRSYQGSVDTREQ